MSGLKMNNVMDDMASADDNDLTGLGLDDARRVLPI